MNSLRDEVFDRQLEVALEELLAPEDVPIHDPITTNDNPRPWHGLAFVALAATVVIAVALLATRGNDAETTEPAQSAAETDTEGEALAPEQDPVWPEATLPQLLEALDKNGTRDRAEAELVRRGAPAADAVARLALALDPETPRARERLASQLRVLRGLRQHAAHHAPALMEHVADWPVGGCADLLKTVAVLAPWSPHELEMPKFEMSFNEVKLDSKVMARGFEIPELNALHDATTMFSGRKHVRPDQSIPRLIELLESENGYARIAALEMLGTRGADAMPAVPAIEACLSSEDHPAINKAEWVNRQSVRIDQASSTPEIHATAAEVLLGLAPDTPRAVLAWRHRLAGTGTIKRRAQAATRIGQLFLSAQLSEEHRAEVLEALEEAALASDTRLAAAAITALGMAGKGRKSAVATLKRIMRGENERLRKLADAALRQVIR